jgi:hypothetical protein
VKIYFLLHRKHISSPYEDQLDIVWGNNQFIVRVMKHKYCVRKMQLRLCFKGFSQSIGQFSPDTYMYVLKRDASSIYIYMCVCVSLITDKFKPPERPISKPFRLSVNDIFKGTGSGFCVSGRVETGVVQVADKVIVQPQNEAAVIKGKYCIEVTGCCVGNWHHQLNSASKVRSQNQN